MDRINSRLDIAEKTISEFEGIVIETIQTEMQEEKRLKNEQTKSSCLKNTKDEELAMAQITYCQIQT